MLRFVVRLSVAALSFAALSEPNEICLPNNSQLLQTHISTPVERFVTGTITKTVLYGGVICVPRAWRRPFRPFRSSRRVLVVITYRAASGARTNSAPAG